jgi:hypothetical protein
MGTKRLAKGLLSGLSGLGASLTKTGTAAGENFITGF